MNRYVIAAAMLAATATASRTQPFDGPYLGIAASQNWAKIASNYQHGDVFSFFRPGSWTPAALTSQKSERDITGMVYAGWGATSNGLYFGGEIDFMIGSIKSTSQASNPMQVFYSDAVSALLMVPTVANFTNSIHVATLRGRLGFTFGNSLIYATGGLAVGKDQARASNQFLASSYWGIDIPARDGPDNWLNSMRTGYVVGGGVEHMLTPHVAVRIEYQFVDLGSATYTIPVVSDGPTIFKQDITVQRLNLGLLWRM